jgi:hypothetical protein
MRPYLRYVRIAITALALVACVAVLALWKRSYNWADMASISLRGEHEWWMQSMDGELRVARPATDIAHGLRIRRQRPEKVREHSIEMPSVWVFRWPFMKDNERLWPVIPHWFVAAAFATLAAAPWLRRRFSLQTLLVITTLAAIVLTAIVLSRP